MSRSRCTRGTQYSGGTKPAASSTRSDPSLSFINLAIRSLAHSFGAHQFVPAGGVREPRPAGGGRHIHGQVARQGRVPVQVRDGAGRGSPHLDPPPVAQLTLSRPSLRVLLSFRSLFSPATTRLSLSLYVPHRVLLLPQGTGRSTSSPAYRPSPPWAATARSRCVLVNTSPPSLRPRSLSPLTPHPPPHPHPVLM